MPREQKPSTPQAAIRFEKAQKLAQEGEKARADYEAAARAADAKIARLKALRLAKETADKEAAPVPVAGKAKEKR